MSLARVAVLAALVAGSSGCRTLGSTALAISTQDFPRTWSDEAAPAVPVASASPPPPRPRRAPATPRTVPPAVARGAQTAPQGAQSTVILKDGTRILGRITILRPGELVTVISDGAERTFFWERVDEVVVDPKP